MRRILLLVVGVLMLPAFAQGQPVHCDDCLLGIFDDINLNKNWGTVTPGALKDIYIGIRLGAGETGVTGLEFSVAGMRQTEDGILVTAVEGVTDPAPNIILGQIAAPADTTAGSTGQGGINAAWPSCIEGTRALLKVSFLAFAPLPTNKVLKVLRKYPPTAPDHPFPILIRCDNPVFTKVVVNPGCYVINWDETTPEPSGCIAFTGVTAKTWSTVKEMYR
jgi:hypothetical protein